MATVKLALQKPAKAENTVKGPIVLMYEKCELTPQGVRKLDQRGQPIKYKVTKSLNFGEQFEEETQTAYEIVAKYEGLVVVVQERTVKVIPEAPKNAMLKDEVLK